MQATLRIIVIVSGFVGGWFVGILLGYAVIGLWSVLLGGSPPDLTVPLIVGVLFAGIGAALAGRLLRDSDIRPN